MKYTNDELKAQFHDGLITVTEYLDRKAPEKHNHAVVFGRKVDGCPRCEELKAGASPVQGWGTRSKQFEMSRIDAIRKHDCKKSNCGPVCTFGDW